VDFKKKFDQPLPIINKDIDKLYFESPGSFRGQLTVKNDGGGVIAGRVMSNSSAITFDPEEFSGNDSEILFHIDTSMYNIGDILKTSAVMITNGGEHIVEFDIKIVPPAIETKEGTKIVSLNGFFEYANEQPAKASQLFRSHEFSIWLHSTGYEYMDFYERMLKDLERERAVFNFLTFNGYKKKSIIAFKNPQMVIKIAPYMDVYKGSINIVKHGIGYVDEQIFIKNNVINDGGLQLEYDRLIDSYFNENGEAQINFLIETDKLKAKRNTVIISIEEEKMELIVQKLDIIEVSLEKEFLQLKESSYIRIKNNCNSPISVDISPKDGFVKLENNKFDIKERAKIPFRIELSTMHTAQYTLVRQPEVTTEISVNAEFNNNLFTKKLNLIIGWF